MDIKIIEETIRKNVREEQLDLNDSTAGTGPDSLDIFLKETFKLEALHITGISMETDEEKLTLLGQSVVCGEEAQVMILFFQKGSRICTHWKLDFEISGTELPDGQEITLSGVCKQYIFDLQEPLKWEYSAAGSSAEEVSLEVLMGLLLGGYISPGTFPPVALENLRLEIQIKHGKLMRSRVKIESLAAWSVWGGLAVKKLGAEVHRLDSYFGFAFYGSLELGGLELPLVLRYMQDRFLFGIDTGKEGTKIPSLADVTALAGLGDLADMIPVGLNLGNPVLTELTAEFPTDLSGISSLSFSVKTTAPWELFGLSFLSLSDILVSFSIQWQENAESIVSGCVEGKVNLGPFAILLSAKKSGPEGAYEFRGILPEKQPLYLKDVISEFSVLFTGKSIDFPDAVPDIVLKYAGVSFDTGKNSFSAQALAFVQQSAESTLTERFFRICAEVSVESRMNGGTRTYAGCFRGTLLLCGQEFTVEYLMEPEKSSELTAGWSCPEGKSPLSLNNLLSELGLEPVPDLLGSLEIELNLISITCYLNEKRIVFQVISTRYGTMEFTIWDREDGKQYVFEVTCAAELSLAGLPVIGRGFHLLDEVSIRDLGICVSTVDIPEKKITKGGVLKGALCTPEGAQSFALQTQSAAQMSAPRNGDSDPAELVKWFEVEKSLGILSFHRLGVTFRQGRTGFVMDASLQMGPVRVSLMEAGMGLRLSEPSDIGLYLSGLGLFLETDSVALEGALKKQGMGKSAEYTGKILVKAGEFSLFAAGSYADSSVFAYGVLCASIGGPPAFFVTGLAAGFGYNRRLLLPSIEKVHTFPLVRGAFGTIKEEALLSEMEQFISVEKGQYFAAAGVKFRSFEMIDSFALAAVSFGKELDISLLGLSEITVPANLKEKEEPIAYAQLALRARINPSQGLFSVQAELTDESYILSKKCILTGGFAFFIWFGGEHKGDFVISLGGYHRNYEKPEHYPDVPRLGFTWELTDNLVFSGQMYFALTPAEIMAGGDISAVYKSGELRAWFHARLDVIIGWKPFYYDVDLYVGLGASYRMYVLFGYVTFKLELSAALHIWGPEFTGIAEITWFIISFTIRFGSGKQGKAYIDWDDFKKSFLPHEKEKDGGKNSAEGLVPGTITVAEGLKGEENSEEESENVQTAVVHPDALKLCVKSVIPITHCTVNGKSCADGKENRLGVLSMGENRSLENDVQIILERQPASGKPVPVDVEAEIIYERVPNALWGKKENVTADNSLIDEVMTGVYLTPEKKPAQPSVPSDYFLKLGDLMLYEKVVRSFAGYHLPTPEDPEQTDDNTAVFAETVMAQAVVERRKTWIKGLNDFGFELDENISLRQFADNCRDLFSEDMRLKTLV